MTQDTITQWIQRLHDVDEEAAHEIWMAYFPKLVRLAREKLGSHPRRAADEEDIALSAMKSFFRGAEAGRFELHDRHDLWNLLVTITVRKVTAERRRFMAEKRGGGAVRDEAAIAGNRDADSAIKLAEIALDKNHMPELAEDVARMCEDLLGQLKDEKLRKTALLKMEGYTNREIADQMACSVSRIKQRLASIREKWWREVRSDD